MLFFNQPPTKIYSKLLDTTCFMMFNKKSIVTHSSTKDNWLEQGRNKKTKMERKKLDE